MCTFKDFLERYSPLFTDPRNKAIVDLLIADRALDMGRINEIIDAKEHNMILESSRNAKGRDHIIISDGSPSESKYVETWISKDGIESANVGGNLKNKIGSRILIRIFSPFQQRLIQLEIGAGMWENHCSDLSGNSPTISIRFNKTKPNWWEKYVIEDYFG